MGSAWVQSPLHSASPAPCTRDGVHRNGHYRVLVAPTDEGGFGDSTRRT